MARTNYLDCRGDPDQDFANTGFANLPDSVFPGGIPFITPELERSFLPCSDCYCTVGALGLGEYIHLERISGLAHVSPPVSFTNDLCAFVGPLPPDCLFADGCSAGELPTEHDAYTVRRFYEPAWLNTVIGWLHSGRQMRRVPSTWVEAYRDAIPESEHAAAFPAACFQAGCGGAFTTPGGGWKLDFDGSLGDPCCYRVYTIESTAMYAGLSFPFNAGLGDIPTPPWSGETQNVFPPAGSPPTSQIYKSESYTFQDWCFSAVLRVRVCPSGSYSITLGVASMFLIRRLFYVPDEGINEDLLITAAGPTFSLSATGTLTSPFTSAKLEGITFSRSSNYTYDFSDPSPQFGGTRLRGMFEYTSTNDDDIPCAPRLVHPYGVHIRRAGMTAGTMQLRLC